MIPKQTYLISAGQRERAAARREQTRLQRIERARALAKSRVRPEASPVTQKRVQITRKREKLAAMGKAKCANPECGKTFPTRVSGQTPQLCCPCALKSLPPLDVRWSGEHPLARNV